MSVTTIASFIQQLQNIPRFKDYELFFRGHSNSEYDLLPSIYRKNGFIKNEHHLFREFLIRTPSDFLNDKSALEKLVKMQHYGLPTRLLDITSNPLVALYFAAARNEDKDGSVIAFRIPKSDIKYFDSDTVSVIANISKRPASFDIREIRNFDIKKFNTQGEISYLIHEIREEKSYFQPIIVPGDLERVVAVKVKQSNNRIIKQSGAFLLYGINSNKCSPAKIPDEWILNLDLKGVDFKIDKQSKNVIMDELNVLGINEATLFPELDNQAEYLKKYYE